MKLENCKIALICASNQNRSMEAHALLLNKGFNPKNIHSYGTSQQCKLPGPSIDKPNIYNFGTPYRKIYEDLRRQNPELYRKQIKFVLMLSRYKSNGIINMLERNMRVKEAPERWQEEKIHFDIVFTFEDRVFDILVEDVLNRDTTNKNVSAIHIFNLNTKDNHEEAAISAVHVFQLLQMLSATDEFEDRIDSVLEDFQKKSSREILHTVVFY